MEVGRILNVFKRINEMIIVSNRVLMSIKLNNMIRAFSTVFGK